MKGWGTISFFSNRHCWALFLPSRQDERLRCSYRWLFSKVGKDCVFFELWLFIVMREPVFPPFNYFLPNQPIVKMYCFIHFPLYSVRETTLFKDWHFKFMDLNFLSSISVVLIGGGKDSFVSKGYCARSRNVLGEEGAEFYY